MINIDEDDPAYGACSAWIMGAFDAIAFDDTYECIQPVNELARMSYVYMVRQGPEVYN